jgi:anti-sigma regulatory factor (Ser/Thr protein kinase)
MMFLQLAVPVSDSSQIGEVRRQVQRIACQAGLNESECSNAAIVATELATNLSRYATGGEILLRSFEIAGTTGVEVLAIDRGPGIADVSRCLEDGFSTGGTAGQGLGAVRRLSTEFDIFSAQPGGTVVLARLEIPPKSSRSTNGFAWGTINRPAPREQVSGDTWRIAERHSELALLIADGLGHGPLAAAAADTAAAAFDEDPFLPLPEYFTAADRRMRATRGAAAAVAQISASREILKYAGVGNIAGTLRPLGDAKGRGLMSHNGTVGAEMRKVVSLDFECPRQALLIMHSDGLKSRWSLEAYPGLVVRHPAVVAAVLYRDFCRGNDDVTVVVVRFSSGDEKLS